MRFAPRILLTLVLTSVLGTPAALAAGGSPTATTASTTPQFTIGGQSTPQPALGTPFGPLQSQVDKGNDAMDYAKFLTWKGMLTREPPRRPDLDRPGGPSMHRSDKWKYAFYGSRDRSTGAVHLPPQRVSVRGGAVDDMEDVPMADVPGTIATFTIDRLAFSMSPPVVAAVVDYDGGGRYPVEMTDVDPAEVKIGMRVEMTFRRLFTADGIHNYFWKARPIR